MRRYALLFTLAVSLAPAESAAGQAAKPARRPSPAARAAASITANDIARRIGIIADDSMLGRDTPSRGLDLTAQYVADEFKRAGLKPGGANGGWFQHYSITRRKLNADSSAIALRGPSGEVRFPLNATASSS